MPPVERKIMCGKYKVVRHMQFSISLLSCKDNPEIDIGSSLFDHPSIRTGSRGLNIVGRSDMLKACSIPKSLYFLENVKNITMIIYHCLFCENRLV
jgi:hypothetical protein